jgi:hypothetical protein
MVSAFLLASAAQRSRAPRARWMCQADAPGRTRRCPLRCCSLLTLAGQSQLHESTVVQQSILAHHIRSPALSLPGHRTVSLQPVSLFRVLRTPRAPHSACTRMRSHGNLRCRPLSCFPQQPHLWHPVARISAALWPSDRRGPACPTIPRTPHPACFRIRRPAPQMLHARSSCRCSLRRESRMTA